ncbi:MAG: SRPBCC family protein [Bacteroidales bacterium]|nr:SRPBCC family protein [Bacteroidales bacterium]
MTKFESTVQQIHSPQSAVYNKLSDLTNLSAIQQRASDPDFIEKIKASGQVPEDKIAPIQEALQRLVITPDSITYPGSPVGDVTLRIIERDYPKCIKFEIQNAPIQGNLWIQILPMSTYESKLRCTIGAELNFLMKQMAKKPLQEGVEKLAEMLAMIPYGY